MAEGGGGIYVRPADRIGRGLEAVCRWLALAGGIVLAALTVMAVVSILGRWLTGKPISGDFELVQLGCAVAVSCFLPHCQMRRGHVIVDFFTHGAGPRAKALMDGIGALLLALCAALISWRLALGGMDYRATGEGTMILGVPIWWTFVPMVPAFALLALAGLYTSIRDFRGLAR